MRIIFPSQCPRGCSMNNKSLLLLLIASVFSLPALAATCSDMSRLQINGVTISEIESRDSGTLEQRNGPDLSLPPHCRVAAVLSPSDDSEIGMELWLPENWNGKFLALGNGGWAGSISFSAMAQGLQAGYAVASNDTGHKGGRADFAVGHPEKLVDFGWRAMHEMTVHSKSMIETFYESAPRLSYYQGCSTGGRQGMIAAQRFPEDFDAIIAGAPVNNQLTLNTTQLYNLKTLIENRSLTLSADEKQLLHDAVLAACEDTARGGDGVMDGMLNNPLACDFDPGVLQCSAGETGTCLSPDQVQAARQVYAGTFSETGAMLYPGHAKGFELGWRIPAPDAEPTPLQTDATRFIVYEDPNWDWREFDLDRDLALVLDKAGDDIEALDTDLSAFKARGGKILFYHGWNDPGPSPHNTINYYEGVLETMGSLSDQGASQEDFMRLFLMPGMGHCRGGIGPDNADFLGALDAWVEGGIAPDSITASRIREGRVDMTRPLCAYPEAAKWNGRGNPDDVSSYSCQ